MENRWNIHGKLGFRWISCCGISDWKIWRNGKFLLLELRGNICEKRWKRGDFDGFLYGTSMETWGNSMENRRKPWIPGDIGDSCGKSVGIMLG